MFVDDLTQDSLSNAPSERGDLRGEDAVAWVVESANGNQSRFGIFI